ncbi:MAG: restriction endonuclease subunit S [Chloroflexi bacterium]|nr:restriction endonuclease subunit S [Chloroflexota bacterium]
MTNGWQTASIGEVVKPIERAEVPMAGTTYRQIGVRLWGQGAYERESIDGSQTKYATLSRVESGDIVVNKIWARNGSVAVVSDKLSGCFGSGEFPTFAPDQKKLDPRWFHWMTKTKWFWQACDEKSQGTSGKNRIRPEKFLEIEIPIPPLDEQRRIVERVEALAIRIEKAQSLRDDASEETVKYSASMANKVFTELVDKNKPIPIGNTFIFRLDLIRPTDGKSGKIQFIGLQHIESNTGRRISEDNVRAEDLTGRKFYFSPGEIVYGYLRPYLNKVWIADCEGICSVDQYVIRPNPKIIDTSYLAHFMRSPVFLERAIELTHNLLLPRLRSGLFGSILIPVPPLDEQRRIVAYLDSVQARLAALRELQSATGEELSALLPSVLDRAFKGEL